jgi:hypothetical protein
MPASRIVVVKPIHWHRGLAKLDNVREMKLVKATLTLTDKRDFRWQSTAEGY